MTKLGLLGATAVVLSSALAGPAMAQQVIYNPGYCAQYYPDANCQNKGPNNPYTGDYQRRIADQQNHRVNGDWDNGGWHDSWNDNRRDRRTDSGVWPADVAAGVVGGAIGTAGAAVGTAGAIATAPFPGDSYAYYDNGYYNGGYNGWSGQSYGERNGFVCQPGTWFTGEDGRRHPCQ